MKIKTLLLLTIAFIMLPVPVRSAFERCMMCGMDAAGSETKFIVQIVEGAGDVPPGKYSFCCLHCLVLFRTCMKGGKFGFIRVRDYNTVTRTHDSGEMADAGDAFYLVESGLRPRGSMVPFMAAFSARETAERYRKIYGGRILNWKEAWKYMEIYTGRNSI